MSDSEFDNQIALDIEKNVAGRSGVVDFSEIYKELSQVKASGSDEEFTKDLAAINTKLHDDGVLPNLQISGIGDDNTISLTSATDKQSGTVTSSAAAVNIDDFRPSISQRAGDSQGAEHPTHSDPGQHGDSGHHGDPTHATDVGNSGERRHPEPSGAQAGGDIGVATTAPPSPGFGSKPY